MHIFLLVFWLILLILNILPFFQRRIFREESISLGNLGIRDPGFRFQFSMLFDLIPVVLLCGIFQDWNPGILFASALGNSLGQFLVDLERFCIFSVLIHSINMILNLTGGTMGRRLFKIHYLGSSGFPAPRISILIKSIATIGYVALPIPLLFLSREVFPDSAVSFLVLVLCLFSWARAFVLQGEFSKSSRYVQLRTWPERLAQIYTGRA